MEWIITIIALMGVILMVSSLVAAIAGNRLDLDMYDDDSLYCDCDRCNKDA